MSLYSFAKKIFYSFNFHVKKRKTEHFETSIQWKLFDRIRYYDQKKNLNVKIDKSANLQSVIYLDRENLNSATIQKNIDQLAAQDGGIIYLPEGVIDLEQSIELRSQVTLSGITNRTHLQFKQSNFGIVINGNSSANPVIGASVTDIIIQHLGDNRFCSAVYVSYARCVQFENVKILHPRSTGFLMSDQVNNVVFMNCDVMYAGLTGFMFVRDVEDVMLNNCRAEYCEQSGIFLTDLKLPDNIDTQDFDAQLDHTHNVIGNFAPFDFEDPSPYRININHCQFRYNRKMGITTDGVGHLNITDTIISHNDNEGITIDNGSWYCHIYNCHIFDNGRRARQSLDELGGDFVKEMGFMDDGSSKAKLPGISIDNAAHVRIENNFIENNWGDGIKFVRAGYACIIVNNTIKNNNLGVNDKFHFFGILLGNAARQHNDQDDFPAMNNIIHSNNITGPHFSGVHLLPGTKANQVKNNTITGYTFEAIENHTLSGNIVFGNIIC